MRTDTRLAICARCIPIGRRCSRMFRINSVTVIVPYDSLELALIEAWVAGGNYILAMEPHYREALLRKDAKAVAAWEQLGRTAQWLKENIALFRQPAVPIVTALVEPGPHGGDRQSAVPAECVSRAGCCDCASDCPIHRGVLRSLRRIVKPPAPDIVKRIIAHAEAGSTLIVATSPSQQWWRVAGIEADRRLSRIANTMRSGKVRSWRIEASDRGSERVCSRRDRHHHS